MELGDKERDICLLSERVKELSKDHPAGRTKGMFSNR